MVHFREIKDFNDRVDHLLDKINTLGVENLSRDEREWLNHASKGFENFKKQGQQAQKWLQITFRGYKMEKYMSQKGRIVHFKHIISGIVVLTITEVVNNVYNLYLKNGFIENFVKELSNGISPCDADEYLREFIREKYGMDVKKVCELL